MVALGLTFGLGITIRRGEGYGRQGRPVQVRSLLNWIELLANHGSCIGIPSRRSESNMASPRASWPNLGKDCRATVDICTSRS